MLSGCYETFIRRAFKCDYNEHNSKNSYLQNLIETERGSTATKHLGSYDKQLALVKKNIEKAIDKFLKSKPTPIERAALLALREPLFSAYSTSEIISLLERGIVSTERFRDL